MNDSRQAGENIDGVRENAVRCRLQTPSHDLARNGTRRRKATSAKRTAINTIAPRVPNTLVDVTWLPGNLKSDASPIKYGIWSITDRRAG